MEENYQYRPLLLHIAYNMLGSMASAEDVVQEVLVDFLDRDHSQIKSPKSYLARMVSNRSIDLLRQLQRERAHYTGPWLPEPVIEPAWEPEQQTFSLAVLHLMERLSPTERAVYVLRECFDWDYDTIGDLVQKRSANCRQLLKRAKEKLQQAHHIQAIKPSQMQLLSQAFISASQEANFEPLKELFAADINMLSDGGGKVIAALKPIQGPEHCIRFLQGIQKQLSTELRWEVKIIQGDWTLLIWEGQKLRSALLLVWKSGQIFRLFSYLNPDKLTRLQRQIQSVQSE
ncbi:MAG: sigma-70 family RNA polymerase sigma factor [Bacteroidota bacterium]